MENWEIITGAFASVVAFFGGRKMKKADEKTAFANAESAELENLKTVRDAEKAINY